MKRWKVYAAIVGIIFIVGLGIFVYIRTGDGLLAAAAGLLPAIFGLGATNRGNNSNAERAGKIGKTAKRSAERIENSEKRIDSAKSGIRKAAEELRSSARPVGKRRRDSGGDYTVHGANELMRQEDPHFTKDVEDSD